MVNNSFAHRVVGKKAALGCVLPEGDKARRWLRRLFETLFVCKREADNNVFELQVIFKKLEEQLAELILPVTASVAESKAQANQFFEKLPDLYEMLCQDAQAIYEGDPAAKNIGEVFVAYPGYFAITVHRVAHQLLQQKISLLPRILSEYAHSYTGIDIHPGATIGQRFSIDHGTGIVVGETTQIGNGVKLYQGVTLGALSVQKDLATEKRHPTIEDNVVIYANATILGGATVVGHDSIIGGNVWLTRSVLPFSVVFHQSEITVQDKKSFEEPYNFFI